MYHLDDEREDTLTWNEAANARNLSSWDGSTELTDDDIRKLVDEVINEVRSIFLYSC